MACCGGFSLATVDWFLQAIALVVVGIPVVLLALLGVAVRKWSLRAKRAVPSF
jgi:hypothetical protein